VSCLKVIYENEGYVFNLRKQYNLNAEQWIRFNIGNNFSREKITSSCVNRSGFFLTWINPQCMLLHPIFHCKHLRLLCDVISGGHRLWRGAETRIS
jgi:hypothetical protein